MGYHGSSSITHKQCHHVLRTPVQDNPQFTSQSKYSLELGILPLDSVNEFQPRLICVKILAVVGFEPMSLKRQVL